MRYVSRRFIALAGALTVAAAASAVGQMSVQAPAAADSMFAARDYAGALAAYEALLRADSTNARLWYQAGMSAALTNQYERALHAFGRVTAINPGPNGWYNVGAMHARLGHADSAFAALDRAVKMGFANLPLLQADDDLASIRADSRFAALVKAVSTPAAPCLDDRNFRRFDFWVGEWDVTTKGGVAVGTSSVQSVSGGCGLLENWTATNGSTGKSLNTYNGQTQQWMQFWVGQGGGVTEYSESTWDNGAVTFLSRPATAKAAFQRLTFTPLPDGTVRQFGEISTDGGTTWKTGYDFYYHRRRK